MDAASIRETAAPEPDGGGRDGDGNGRDGTGRDGDSSADARRWMRDLAALLALPALWVDHEPAEIAEGLLSVLSSVLQLDAGYVRFDEPGAAGRSLETWRPSDPEPAPEVRVVLEAGAPEPGVSVAEVADAGDVVRRVASLPIALPWETGLVIVSAPRRDFPTERETHLLRTAVGQAAIAVHTARRIAREHAARTTAEARLAEHARLLRALAAEVAPTLESLSSIARQVEEAARLQPEPGAPLEPTPRAARAPDPNSRAASMPEGIAALPLTRRETEVLGLLAQGLNNREIAGVMWLSDRTVERHITSLYRKIGVARRSEATAFALRHGLG